MSSLPRLSAINDTYVVGRPVHEPDESGIFYRGWNVNTEGEVIIREYFPQALAQRSDETKVAVRQGQEELFQYGLDQFVKESDALQQIEHESVAREMEHVAANGTAYRILKRGAGVTLRDGMKRKGRALPEKAARAILMPVLEGLEQLHEAGLVHEGVSPDAVFLAKSGHPLLQNVRSARLKLARRSEQLREALIVGYAAPEQYLADRRVGPWIDVYGCGAVLYYVLTGNQPATARERLQDDTLPHKIARLDASESLRQALRQALALNPSERPSSVAALRDLLDAPTATKTGLTSPDKPNKPKVPQTPLVAEQEAKEETESAEATHDEDAPAAVKDAPAAVKDAPAAVKDRPPRDPDRHDEPTYDEEAEREEAGGPSTSLYAVAALLMLALTGGSLFFLLSDDTAQAHPTQAALLRQQGDSLYEARQYEAAKMKYTRVLATNPDDAYAKRRVDEAEAQLRKLNERQYYTRLSAGDSLLARGKALLAQGDSARGRKAFEKANKKFLKALDNEPNDSLALARVQAAAAQLFPSRQQPEPTDQPQAEEKDAQKDPEEPSRQERASGFRTQMFSYLRRRADSLFEKGEYVASRERFQEALGVKKSEYARDQIDEINGILDKQERADRYAKYMQQGRRHFRNDDPEAAQAAFEKALDAKPDDEEALEQVDRAKTQLVKQRDAEKYQASRVQGLQHMKQGDYQAAIESFRQAFEYRPNDSFAQKQIARAKRQIQQRESKQKAARTDENGIYKVPDVPPRLTVPLKDLYGRMRYPRRAYDAEIEGKAFVKFVVDKKGHVSQMQGIPGHEIGYGIDEEAKRVIKETRFEPGTVNGEPVKAWHTIMLRFQSSDFDE